MMTRAIQDRLRVLAEVVDGLAFLTPLSEAPPPTPAEQEITIELPCGGRLQQRIIVALGPGLGRCLAGNMGAIMDPAEISEADAIEAAHELANVIAGKVSAFSTSANGQAVSLPRSIPACELDPACTCCLHLAEGVVAFYWGP